jgi:hypothetical protein
MNHQTGADDAFAGELHADRYKVKDLLRWALDGTLRIPHFQRPLRWTRQQDLDLLDSLYHRFPVGTLLLWRREAPADLVRFGRLQVEAPETPQARWIIDGQQRINAIVGALLHPQSSRPGRTNGPELVFNLAHRAFAIAYGDLPAGVVPVNRLADPVDTARWARETGATDADHDLAQRVSSALLNYEVPAYVTSAATDNVLRKVFTRTNTTGTPMREEEVFNALNSPPSGEARVLDPLQEVSRGERFGRIADRTLMKVLLAVAGTSPRSARRANIHLLDAMTGHVPDAVRALQRAILMIRDEADVPHARLLPGDLPLVALSHVLHRFPDPCERSIELLVRWFWRAAAADKISMTNEHLERSFRAVNDGDEEDAIQRLLHTVPRAAPVVWPASPAYNLAGRTTRIELAWLASLRPRPVPRRQLALGPTDDLPIDLSELLEPADGGHRTADLARLPAGHPLRGLTAAVLLAPADADLSFAAATQAALLSHALVDTDRQDLADRRFDAVIERRQVRLKTGVESFLRRHARWLDDDDGPSMAHTLKAIERTP